MKWRFFSDTNWPYLMAPFDSILLQVFFYNTRWVWMNTQQEIRHHSSIQSLFRSFKFLSPCWYTFLFSLLGFRSREWNGHDRTLILCSLTHFCVDFYVCFGSLCWWKIQPQPVRWFCRGGQVLIFYPLIFERIHDAMHLKKMSRTSGPQH